MRQWMEQMRCDKGLKLSEAADRAQCSMELLRLLEDTQTRTLPSLALQIARVWMSRAQCMDIGRAIVKEISYKNPLHGKPIIVPEIESDKLFYMRLSKGGREQVARKASLKKEKLSRLQQVTDKAADVLEDALANSDIKALKDAMAALKELVTITRDVYDMPTRAQEQTMRLAQQKMDMDAGKGSADESETGVIQIAMREMGDGLWPEI